MLEEGLHVHFVHDIQAVFSFGHVQDWLGHELVQDQDVVLLLEEQLETTGKVVLEQLALCDERIDLLLFNFPADSVDKKGNFDGVVL
jgi:hypothetical protein